jgi:predicted enzyme related to lactoylglutathione lyase
MRDTEGGNKMAVSENSVHYIEIVTSDVEAVCQLYSKAHNWVFHPQDAKLGGAFVAELPGGSLCGVRMPLSAHEEPLVRIYMQVPDIEQSVQKASDLGAEILLESMDLEGHGKIAIYRLGGIEHGLWQVA